MGGGVIIGGRGLIFATVARNEGIKKENGDHCNEVWGLGYGRTGKENGNYCNGL